MTTDMTQTARMLKAIVIGLGLLIVFGVALIVYEVISRAGPGGGGAGGGGAGGGGDVVSAGEFGPASVSLPAGSRVVEMTAEGNYLSLLVEDAAGDQKVMTIDRRSGALVGVLTLESE